MSIRDIYKVIYAPHKAFREIIQKPGYKGPLAIMLLFILSFSLFHGALSTKVYYDQTAPQLSLIDKDAWTENAGLWYPNPGAEIFNNSQDSIKGSYYGNNSIQIAMKNGNQIYAELNFSESIRCMEDGFSNLTFRLKIVQPLDEPPANMSVYLFSNNTANKYFIYSLDNNMRLGVWNNNTISLGNFQGFHGADWRSITGLKLELIWTNNHSDIVVLVDGVFFHGLYKSMLELYGGTMPLILNSAISAFMQFTIQWVVLGLILYLFLKLFRAQPVWKTMLTVAGFSLITFFIQNLILTGVVCIYPQMHLSLETLGGVPGEGQTGDAQSFMSLLTIKYDVLDRIVYYVWITALCSIAVRSMFNFSWNRSISISFLSSLISMLVFRFLTYQAVWI